MEPKFQKGEKVRWEKNMRQYDGIVYAVIPAGKGPLEVVKAEEFKTFNIKPLGLISDLTPRTEDSFLIESRIGDRGQRVMYWPATKSLERSE